MPGYPNESFALYLPETDPGPAGYPVLFVFDPAARGKVGVSVFAAAAAENGWAVFCSNGSRNGSYQQNFEVAQRLIDYTFQSYPLNNEKIYTAGFSGGARLAGAIAVLSGSISGVIGCGASFSQNTGHFPSPGANFVWAGIVGNQDMNYQELLQAEGWLTSIALPHRLFFFAGGHRWPPQDAILRATRYLKFATDQQKGQAANSLKDLALEKELILADSLETDGDLLGAVRTLRDLQKNYPAADLPEDFARRMHQLASSKALEKQKRSWDKLSGEEENLWAYYFAKFQKEFKAVQPEPDIRWWAKQRDLLEQRYQESESPQLQDMVARIKNRLFATLIETADPLKHAAGSKKFSYCSQLLITFFPKQGYSWVRQAEALMLLGKSKEALDALKQAANLGAGPIGRIRSNPLFKDLLKDPEFPFPLK